MQEKFIGWVYLERMPFDRYTEGVGSHATGYGRAIIDEDGALVIIPTFEDDCVTEPEEGEEVKPEAAILDWWFGTDED